MKIIGSIQARLGSTRLPGKVLKPIAGVPLLLRHVRRLRRSRLLDEIVVATTTNPADDEIVDVCREAGVAFYRGSENDVLGRVSGLVRDSGADVHAEFYGDSPLTDAHLVDETLGVLLKAWDRLDFVSNSLKTTYPPGQEVLCYRASSLLEADALVPRTDPLREHCGLHLIKRPDRFRQLGLEAPEYYRAPDLYLEVDTAEDFEVVSAVFEHFLSLGQEYFSLAQILDFFRERPELSSRNRGVERRWKQFRKDD